MKIDTAEFVLSAQSPKQFLRDGLPEIAFVGRSNVGKSSLLNRLLHRKSLARTSSTPGRTQAVNYFRINRRLYFVDLPGYGYAKAAKSARRRWADLVDAYFRRSGAGPARDEGRLLVQLIDGKVGATPLDIEARDYFTSLDLRCVAVATKIDKAKRNRRLQGLEAIRQALELPDHTGLIPFSAVTGEGVKELWKEISDFLEECHESG